MGGGSAIGMESFVSTLFSFWQTPSWMLQQGVAKCLGECCRRTIVPKVDGGSLSQEDFERGVDSCGRGRVAGRGAGD